MEGVEADKDKSIDLMVVTRLKNESDTMEVCKAAKNLAMFDQQIRRMYKRYMDKWLQ